MYIWQANILIMCCMYCIICFYSMFTLNLIFILISWLQVIFYQHHSCSIFLFCQYRLNIIIISYYKYFKKCNQIISPVFWAYIVLYFTEKINFIIDILIINIILVVVWAWYTYNINDWIMNVFLGFIQFCLNCN